MKKTHTIAIAVLIGVAAMLGAFAANRTVQLGAATRAQSQAQLLQRERRLTAAERALRTALGRPPAGATAAAQRTVYVRPAPIVVHTHGGEHDDSESGSGD